MPETEVDRLREDIAEAQQRWVRAVQVGAAEMLRADKAEAALARLTDDSMAERIAEQVSAILDAEVHDDLCGCDRFPGACVTYGDRIPWTHCDVETVVRATIRAIAASET